MNMKMNMKMSLIWVQVIIQFETELQLVLVKPACCKEMQNRSLGTTYLIIYYRGGIAKQDQITVLLKGGSI